MLQRINEKHVCVRIVNRLITMGWESRVGTDVTGYSHLGDLFFYKVLLCLLCLRVAAEIEDCIIISAVSIA